MVWNIVFHFHPENWGKMNPFWLYNIGIGGSTTQLDQGSQWPLCFWQGADSRKSSVEKPPSEKAPLPEKRVSLESACGDPGKKRWAVAKLLGILSSKKTKSWFWWGHCGRHHNEIIPLRPRPRMGRRGSVMGAAMTSMWGGTGCTWFGLVMLVEWCEDATWIFSPLVQHDQIS